MGVMSEETFETFRREGAVGICRCIFFVHLQS